MKSKIILFVIILLNFGCKSKPEQKDRSDGIDLKNTFFTIDLPELMNKKREVKLSEIANSVEYVPLETTQNSILGTISEAKFTKDCIFIAQGRGQPIVQFDRSGKFIRTIGSIGRGPKEYVVMRCLNVDDGNKVIYVLSSYNGNVQAYSFDGDFIKTIRFPQSYGDIVWARDSLFICYYEPKTGTEKFVFEERNSNNELLQTVKNQFFWQHNLKYTFANIYSGRKIFYRLNSKLHFKGWYNDTVFTYNGKNEIIPKFFINLKDLKLPDNLRIEVTGQIPTSPEYYWVSAMESQRYVFMIYSTYSAKGGRPTDNGFIYFDKITMQGSRYINKAGRANFVNDLDGGPDFYPENVNDSLAFSIESPSYLKKYFETNDPRSTTHQKQLLKERLKSKFKDLNDSDNPIIMVVKLKF
jgi:hypothetical protein